MDSKRAEGVLHAWLAVGGSNARFFLDDVLRMLRAKALRQGVVVEDAEPVSPQPDLADHFFLAIAGHLVARLADEVGLHRVQFVPRESETGRVETAVVAVEFLKYGHEGNRGYPGWPVVKTYNYVLGSCVRHVTGQVSPLHDALLGEA